MKFHGGLDGAGCVVRQQGRHLQRYPAVNPARGVVDRAKKIRGLGQVLQGKFEEQCLARLARSGLLMDGIVVETRLLDGLIEDRGVRGQPRHRKFIDVTAQRAARQQSAGDVVEPNTLAEIVQLLGSLHDCSFSGRRVLLRWAMSETSTRRTTSGARWPETPRDPFPRAT